MERKATGPLAGVRILDLTTVMMGPSATQYLAELGADVIKVEAPAGDPIRGIAPGRHPEMGGLFMNANTGKRSIVLDLKHGPARDALLRLAESADVLVYNIRPQAMARLGLSYEDVAAHRPDIIYAGLFGFGQDGPYAAQPAYDDLIQGASLIPWLMHKAGAAMPRYMPSAIADRVVGLAAVSAINAALYHREKTGEGQRIDVPMFETMVGFVIADHLGGLTFDPPLDQGGYPRLLALQRKPYKTSDGYVCALVYNDKQWRAFYEAVGEGDAFATDPRLASMNTRNQHIDELYGEVAARFATRTTADWMELLKAADIPVMPYHGLDTIFDDPHLKAIGFFAEDEHPTEGRIRRVRAAGTWSKTQPGHVRHAPRKGADTESILHEAGLDKAAIAAATKAG
ncbi:CaiB/BaiF CoA transferase family protein [Enterovirga rhinocerotis]|uniref:Crotonobetainyl-CoA:carnitine CoA-transferase CaiB-like acyl-CoA transferase n=1 Tax=Enterovirga rhinocerotis TaxID=1339210 RepID=A0A4V3DXX0_9HYPH|nr:CoA transferase [Enterovirga rhinocerotis]TDR90369.1 crotonobetainyl-CoA:carnitine CoA-transferase CaiB-like acyl-CoA transferase [Enterovirga rhinocerotis]